MKNRTGSTTLASILGVAGLLAVGFGTFAAYKSATGGCGGCCAGEKAATPVVSTVADTAKEGSCCPLGGGKAIAASEGDEKADACCKDKAASECCKSGEQTKCCEDKPAQCPVKAAESNG